MWYVGLDTHLRTSTCVILNDRGQTVKTQTLKGPWSKMVRFLQSLDQPLAVCYEASCGYGPLHDALQQFCQRVVVAQADRAAPDLGEGLRHGGEDDLGIVGAGVAEDQEVGGFQDAIVMVDGLVLHAEFEALGPLPGQLVQLRLVGHSGKGPLLDLGCEPFVCRKGLEEAAEGVAVNPVLLTQIETIIAEGA